MRLNVRKTSICVRLSKHVTTYVTHTKKAFFLLLNVWNQFLLQVPWYVYGPKNIISCFFFFTKRFGGRFISWWGEVEILFRFVYVPNTCTTIKSLFLFLFLQTFKRWEGWIFFWGKGDSKVHRNFVWERGGGLVQSPGSRVQSLESRVQGSLQLLGYAIPAVIVNAGKLLTGMLKSC